MRGYSKTSWKVGGLYDLRDYKRRREQCLTKISKRNTAVNHKFHISMAHRSNKSELTTLNAEAVS